MKVEKLTITAEIIRRIDSDECNQLILLYHSGESIYGLVDQFSFMPFVVTDMTQSGDSVLFRLLMTVGVP